MKYQLLTDAGWSQSLIRAHQVVLLFRMAAGAAARRKVIVPRHGLSAKIRVDESEWVDGGHF